MSQKILTFFQNFYLHTFRTMYVAVYCFFFFFIEFRTDECGCSFLPCISIFYFLAATTATMFTIDQVPGLFMPLYIIVYTESLSLYTQCIYYFYYYYHHCYYHNIRLIFPYFCFKLLSVLLVPFRHCNSAIATNRR